MKENINFSMRLAKQALLWHRGPVHVSNGLRPVLEMVSSGARIFRVNSALFSMWFLFPLLLIVTSDWIGLLVIFQALTAAVRLRTSPAARSLAAFSAGDAAHGRYDGECCAR